MFYCLCDIQLFLTYLQLSQIKIIKLFFIYKSKILIKQQPVLI